MLNEQFDRDEEWLLGRLATVNIKPTTAQIDRFCEKVFDSVQDGELESTSRTQALKEVFGCK